MAPSDLTKDSLLAVLHDAARRADLIATLEREQGSHLPLNNHYTVIAEQCTATADEIRTTIHLLLTIPSSDRLIEPFVFHANVPDDVLFDLSDRRRCLVALSHRTGPQQLLERLAADHHLSEAITTLALRYYSTPEVAMEDFAVFLAMHKDDRMLRGTMTRAAAGTLRGAPVLSAGKQAMVSAIFGSLPQVSNHGKQTPVRRSDAGDGNDALRDS